MGAVCCCCRMGPTYCHPRVERDEGDRWRHPLCGCFDNCGLCAYAYFCPCVVFGRTAQRMTYPCCLCGVLWLFCCGGCYAHMRVRGRMRKEYNIQGSWPSDCLLTYCCGMCSLVQEAQEVEERQDHEEDKKHLPKHESHNL